MVQEIEGTVLEKIYEGADGYTVALVEGIEPTVVVGNMPELKIGERTRFFGEHKNHVKYGKQFAVSYFETALPVDLNDMVLFLGGGFIKGVGEVIATRIVETFEHKTFDVIENEPSLLKDIKGISARLAGEIHDAFAEYFQKKYVYTELMGMGLSANQATRVAKDMGEDCVIKIKNNPYVLIDYVHGIDFIGADRIARKLGILKTDGMRVQNGILNVLKKSLAVGNLFVIKSQLIPHVALHLQVEKDLVETALLTLVKDNKTILKRYAKDFEVVFLKNAYEVESQVATKLFLLRGKNADGKNTLRNSKYKGEIKLTKEQSSAVKTAIDNNLCVITGGPGTGKTTILKAMLEMFYSNGLKCVLAAPTGRAAKRMQEATGETARTIHRLLEYSYDEDAYQCYFRINEENRLDADVVIVDEVSMLDIFLFRNLLLALKPGARLVLVGDADQLPSVGPGNVMQDLITSEVVPTVKLTYKFRNAGNIADAAYSILNGEKPSYDDKEFVLHRCFETDEVLMGIRDCYLKYAKEGYDIQVIAPIKKTEVGTIELNNMLRNAINPPKTSKPEFMIGDKFFREGDRVMQIKNNYARKWKNYGENSEGEGVFNGDIGVIADMKQGVCTVRFEDGRSCVYEGIEMTELDGAFAYTIHKAQGSEFDIVVLPVFYGDSLFLTRNLLYTAVTRAKKKVIMVGNEQTINYMINNGKRGIRRTALCKELRCLKYITE